MKDYYISVDQDQYATYIVAKHLYTSTFNKGTKSYKTTLPSDMILTKADAYISDEKVGKFTREFNIRYRACIGSLIYLVSTKVDLGF